MATRYVPIFRPQEAASIARFRHTQGTKIMMYENNTALAMITNHKIKSGIFILFRSDFIQYDAIQMLAMEMPLFPALASRRGIGKYPPLSAPSGPGILVKHICSFR